MKYLSLILPAFLLISSDMLYAGETAATQPADAPATQPAKKTKTATYKTEHYLVKFSNQWQQKEGPGFLELRGKKGDAKQVWIRMYAIGLRSRGGKFRDLEHVVNDMIFQIRDEFKGKVGKKTTVKVGKDEKIKARRLTGEQPLKNNTIKVLFFAADHPTEKGIVISFSYVGTPKAFEKHKAAAMKILDTWEVVIPKKEEKATN